LVDALGGLGEALKKKYNQEWSITWEAPYAEVIEYGCGPHPISEEGQAAILQFCIRKLGLSGKEAQKAANAICWKIRKNGQEPHPFIRPAVDFIKPKIPKILNSNEDGWRAVCQAIVEKAGDFLEEHGNMDTGALASHVKIERVK
jgi:hypothetical protein